MRALFLILLLAACGNSYRDPDVQIASKALFDPAKYAGTWYEIARFPVPFQKGCTNTTATYTPKSPSGSGFLVVNTCRVDGALKQIEGFAEPDGPGRLRVSFDTVPFVKAPYWVLWTDESYETAVVGVPSGRAGWILSRTPTIRADKLTAAREVLDFNGYDLSQLEATPQ